MALQMAAKGSSIPQLPAQQRITGLSSVAGSTNACRGGLPLPAGCNLQVAPSLHRAPLAGSLLGGLLSSSQLLTAMHN